MSIMPESSQQHHLSYLFLKAEVMSSTLMTSLSFFNWSESAGEFENIFETSPLSYC